MANPNLTQTHQTDHWFTFVILDVLILFGRLGMRCLVTGMFSDGMFSDWDV